MILRDTYKNLDSAILNGLYALRERGKKVNNTIEILNHNIVLSKPYNNIALNDIRSTPLPYAIGEILWYLSGSNDLQHISYYSKFWENISDDGLTVRSAYGHRIFNDNWIDSVGNSLNFSQWKKVKCSLLENKENRQAVINLNLPHNEKTKDEICTIALQFLIRDNKLHLCTVMRSNDIIRGTTFDIYCFTMIQQIMLLELRDAGLKDLKLGLYYHTANSFHLYDRDFGTIENEENILFEMTKTNDYDDEELMLNDYFLNDLNKLFEAEKMIRLGNIDTIKDIEHILIEDLELESKYAFNMICILLLYKYKKHKKYNEYCLLYNRIKRFLINTFDKILFIEYDEILKKLEVQSD